MPSTPRFDALAKKGVLFLSAYSNGVQTRFSIVPMYCSTMDRLSTKWICQHNPTLSLLSFPNILQSRGYETIYVHGGENNFSNPLGDWQWFERVYDPRRPFRKKRRGWGLRDKPLFNVMKMLKERNEKRPFYLAVATLSLHFPMALPDPQYEFLPHKAYDNHVSNILRYSDDALGDFIEAVQKDPEFKNTIFMVAADHGLTGRVPDRASEIVTWIPIALIGKGWNLPPQRISEVRQSVDIGPTILDRLGIEVPNPFVGQSLLRRLPDESRPVFFGTANGGPSAGLRQGPWKYAVRFESRSVSLSDLTTDRPGAVNLASSPEHTGRLRDFMRLSETVFSETTASLRKTESGTGSTGQKSDANSLESAADSLFRRMDAVFHHLLAPGDFSGGRRGGGGGPLEPVGGLAHSFHHGQRHGFSRPPARSKSAADRKQLQISVLRESLFSPADPRGNSLLRGLYDTELSRLPFLCDGAVRVLSFRPAVPQPQHRGVSSVLPQRRPGFS